MAKIDVRISATSEGVLLTVGCDELLLPAEIAMEIADALIAAVETYQGVKYGSISPPEESN